MQTRYALIIPVFLSLGACATPNVDQSGTTFDETAYTTDLNICRGGNFLTASARTFGIAMLGSAYGAIYGAHIGADSGDTAEGAVIGAAVGGAIGLTAGAQNALNRHEADIAGCLAKKGYRIVG